MANDLEKGLQVLADVQWGIGKLVPGWVEGEPEFIRTTFLALTAEIYELLEHFNWRQWKDATEFDPVAAADEFADVLAFLGYVVIFLNQKGVSTAELARAYRLKSDINWQRLVGKVPGYGVKANK